MKRFILYIAAFLMFISCIHAQQGFKWIQSHGGFNSFNPEVLWDIQTDQSGNIYVAGTVNDIFVRDSNGVIIKRQSNSSLDSLHNHGNRDIWLAKYDPQGQLLWHRYAGSGSNNDQYYDMVADENGNCYVAGRLSYDNLRPAHTFGRQRIADNKLGAFIAKVDSGGNLLWHKDFGGDTINNAYRDYNAGIHDLIINHGALSAMIYGGGPRNSNYLLLFDQDSLDLGVHEVRFDLNGNYLGVNSFPFPDWNKMPYIESIQSNSNGYFITGSFNGRDTVLVGSDTLTTPNNNNMINLSFDTAYNLKYAFSTTNSFDVFSDAKLVGDTLFASGDFNVFMNSNLVFDTVNHTGANNVFREGGLFLFDAGSGGLLGLYPSKSPDYGATLASNSADASNYYYGMGGSFSHRMTFSGGTNYIEAVDNCSSCTNRDLFFAAFDRTGRLIAEDVIYSSGFQTDATLAMHFTDSVLYIGGFIGDTVIIPGVDTFITKGDEDAFLAAYRINGSTSLKETAEYIKAENGILAYPNPTEGRLSLMGKAAGKEAVLFNIKGQKVKEYRLDVNAFKQQISLEGLQSGIYFLVIQGTEERQSLKILKE